MLVAVVPSQIAPFIFCGGRSSPYLRTGFSGLARGYSTKSAPGKASLKRRTDHHEPPWQGRCRVICGHVSRGPSKTPGVLQTNTARDSPVTCPGLPPPARPWPGRVCLGCLVPARGLRHKVSKRDRAKMEVEAVHRGGKQRRPLGVFIHSAPVRFMQVIPGPSPADVGRWTAKRCDTAERRARPEKGTTQEGGCGRTRGIWARVWQIRFWAAVCAIGCARSLVAAAYPPSSTTPPCHQVR